ncbi:hypothetical protein [Streptomyces sp. CRN 30]|uniref:hypothetical protein n=1 Tax=Streptomyces sp. CRN 30 TaxID=3075613 RepID=UPI002A80937E|nr:hypothetical protein [Streptomyces sp. CRN 30]
MPATERIEAALRAAGERLLKGAPIRSDGSLTVASLAAEAGISRASAYRCPQAVNDFRTSVAAQGATGSSSTTLRQEVLALKAAERNLRRQHAREVRELRTSIDVLAQHVQYLTLENQRLTEANDQRNGVTRIDRVARQPRNGREPTAQGAAGPDGAGGE